MIWWDFSNTQFVMMFSIICSILGFLIILLLSFIIDSILHNNYLNKVSFNHNSLRVFILNPKHDIVTYFDKSNIKLKRYTNMSGFYSFFHEDDQDKIKSWIYSIVMKPDDVEKFLEADVYTRKNRCHYFSLLRFAHYDSKVGLIHLESTLMKFVTPNSQLAKKKHGIPLGVVSKDEMENIINNEKKARGFCFAIRFFFLKPVVKNDDEAERFVIMNFKNVIYPYAHEHGKCRQIVDNDSHQLFLFDLYIDKKESALRISNSLEHDIKKRISIMGLEYSFSFSIGIVENANYYQDYDLIINNAEQACIYAHQNNMYSYLYNRKISRSIISSEKYAKQFEKMIKSGNLRFLYRPIINLEKNQIIGYLSYVKIYDSPFTNYLEMHKYSILANKEKELFSVVCKGIIPAFISQGISISKTLYLTVSLTDAGYIKTVLSQIKDINKVNIVLIFEEEQLVENAIQTSLIVETLSDLKEAGFGLSMLNRDKNLLLDESIYILFDSFIVGSSMVEEIRKSTSSRLSVHTLVEQLLKYKKPIIATDLPSWQAIELIIKSGISIISSDIISPSNEMILPVDKKHFDRTLMIFDKYNN